MSSAQAEGALPTPAASVLDLPESNDEPSHSEDAFQATKTVSAENGLSTDAQNADGSVPGLPQTKAVGAGHGIEMSEMQSLLLKLQADHNALLDQFNASRGIRPSSPASSVDEEESRSRTRPRIEPRINPQFLEKFQDWRAEPKKIYPIDVLVGDPGRSTETALGQGARPVIANNMRSSRRHWSEDKENEAALKELDRMKGHFMPEQVRINLFPLAYLLRMVFGDQANVSHELSRKGVILLRPYKNLLKNRGVLKEKLGALLEFLHALVEKKKAEEEKKTEEKAKAKDILAEQKTMKHNTSEPGEEKAETLDKASINDCDPGEPEAHQLLTADDIDDMLEKVELFCCDDCIKSLSEDLRTIQQAKDIITCLSVLMEEFLVPVHESFRSRTPPQVTYNHLWHLFQPGDHVVTKVDPDIDFRSSGVYSSLWRVLRVQGGRRVLCKRNPPPFPPQPTHPRAVQPPPPPNPINNILPFTIDTYLLDHDGFTIVPVRRRFLIMPFTGQRKVKDLEVFPLEYSSERSFSMDNLISRGRKFMEFVASPKTGYHLDCRGANLLKKEEMLDEQMIVDMEDYWKWEKHTNIPAYSAPEPLDKRETTHFCPAFEPCMPDDLNYVTRCVIDYYIDQELMEEHVRDQYHFKNYSERRLKESVEMSEDDYAICTHQLRGYLLRSRKHATVHIDSAKKIHRPRAGLSFKQLVLPSEIKGMIQSQVQEHFRKKTSQTKFEGPGLDLVGGKGPGLTILIHGAPGVGKTATAECVADLVEKPLYPLTCGDLGHSATQIEQKLRDQLYYATRWDCIMLLDEADVFMAKRTKEDHVRNATVSVFLRMLEYHTGVLILTTNRIGIFDEAFKSRIHLPLFYPNFDEDDTVAVFRTFIQRTKKAYPHFEIDAEAIEAFARKHYQSAPEDARWNGRQIRNAFQRAIAMAEYDARTEGAGLEPTDFEAYAKDCKVPVKLGKSQFKAVAKDMRFFDDYLEETMNGTYQKRLQNDHVRKTKTREREKDKGKKDEMKELRRELEALKKSKGKKAVSESDESDESEEEKAKKKKKKGKDKEKGKAAKKTVQFDSTGSDSDS